MTLFLIACGVQVLQLAIASGLCHAIIQRLYGQHFLRLRRHDYWLHTLSVLLMAYAGILVTSSNSFEILIKAAIATSGLAIGTAVWCSGLEEN